MVDTDDIDLDTEEPDALTRVASRPPPEAILQQLFKEEEPFVCGPNKDEPAGTGRLLAKRAVVLFFGASWHEPCAAVSRALGVMYASLLRRSPDFVEIVYVTDNSKETLQGYHSFTKDMPWLCTMLQDAESNAKLRSAFGVTSFPHLVVLDDELQIEHLYANMLLVDDPDGALFPWSVSNDTNETPIVTRLRRASLQSVASTPKTIQHKHHEEQEQHPQHQEDHHNHHAVGHGFYNPPKLNLKVVLNKNGELEEVPRRFLCCTFTKARPKVEGVLG
jgi:hypothetical protein